MTVLADLFFVSLLFSGILSLGLVAYVSMRLRDTVGATWLIVILLGQSVWSLAYALQLSRDPVGWWLLLDRVVVTGATFVVAGWWLFVLEYAGYRRRLPRAFLAASLLPAILGVLIAWTNHYHALFWNLSPAPAVLQGTGGRYLRFSHGALYEPWLIYLLAMATATLLLLGAAYVRSRSLHRSQVGAAFVAILLPLLGNVLFGLVGPESLAIDVTPVLFTVSNLMVVVAMVRFRFLDNVPVSRHELLEQLAEGVVVTDDDATVRHCNDAATEMFGTDLVGEPLPPSVRLEATDDHATARVATGLAITVNETSRFFDVKRTPYTDPSGTQRGAIYVFQDVTDREERSAELARQNERLEEFASVVSHDLRSPLAAAMGRLELAQAECDSDDLTAAESALDRMETMIGDVLQLARQGQPIAETGPVSLRDVATDTWRTTETEAAILAVEDDLSFMADEGRLQQLLENLFRNAVEHGSTSPPSDSREDAVEGGGNAVSVRVGRVSEPAGFYVADDGTGIPEDEREDAFRSGYTTADGGTGFGLAIVSEIVDAHGWDVSVTSSRDGGARFEISGVDLAP